MERITDMTLAEEILWKSMENVPEYKQVFDIDVLFAILAAMESYANEKIEEYEDDRR